jgi:hypothetical protein
MSTTGPPLTARQHEALAVVKRLWADTGEPVSLADAARAQGVVSRSAARPLAALCRDGYLLRVRAGGWLRYRPAALIEPPAGRKRTRRPPPRRASQPTAEAPPRRSPYPDPVALAACRAEKAARGETPTGTRTVRVPRVHRCHAPEAP